MSDATATFTADFTPHTPGSTTLPRRKRYRKWLILGAVLLMLGFIGNAANTTVEKALKEGIQSDLKTILDADVTALRLWLDQQKSVAQILADHPTVRQRTTELNEIRNGQKDRQALLTSAGQSDLRKLLDPICKERDYLGFVILGPDDKGTVLAATFPEIVGESTGEDEHDEAKRAFKHLLAGKAVVSRPYLCPHPLPTGDGGMERHRPTMFVAAVIRNMKNEPAAVLAFRLRPEAEYSQILSVARSGKTGETYTFNKQGFVLSRSRFEENLRELGMLPKGESSVLHVQLRDPGADLTNGHKATSELNRRPFTVMAKKAIEGKPGVNVDGYRDYRGVMVVGAWTWLDDHDFGIAAEISVAEVYRPLYLLRRVFWGLFSIVLLSALGIVLTSFVIAQLRRRMQSAATQAMQLGPYTLEEKIGEGGMGQVFKASHALLRRPTAVKLIHADGANDKSIARFEREVQQTARLNNAHTIAVYDYGRTADGVFYYAMEYLDGLTLEDLVARFGPQPPKRVLHILRQVCHSLNEAHGIGLIHRDIKPANIMLCRHGGEFDVVKVLDFGLVKDMDGGKDSGVTMVNSLTGTPLYMAPEAITNPVELHPTRDLYAVGGVGYFMLTGQHVFDGNSVIEICNHHLATAPMPPSQRVDVEIPSDLEQLLMRCLEKRPENRPQTADELADAFDRCADAFGWSKQEASAWWATVAIRVGKKTGVIERAEATVEWQGVIRKPS